MAMPLSWKIAAGAASLVAALFVWHGVSQYLAARQADELMRESVRAAAQQAQEAKAQARQYQATLAAELKQQRENLASTYQQVNEQARHYQAEQVIRQNQQRQQELRVQASYKLDRNQQCVGGIVIQRSSSSFTQIFGQDGKPVPCHGDTAAAPLR